MSLLNQGCGVQLAIRPASPKLDEEWPLLEPRVLPPAPPPSATLSRPEVSPPPPADADVGEAHEDVAVDAGYSILHTLHQIKFGSLFVVTF